MNRETKDWLLERGGSIDYSSPRYFRRDVHEDRVKYDPLKKSRMEQGKPMWSHVIIELATAQGREVRTVGTKPLYKLKYKYGNTLLKVTYIKRRGGKIVERGRPHKLS